MKLKDILLEQNGRTKTIDFEEAKRIFLTKCKDHWDSATEIYRGVRFGGDYGVVKPSQSTRKSAQTKNYYTLLIDNSEAWSAFPKRSKSIICSTDLAYAKGFGSVYRVIPFDGAKVGICPASDIWGSIDVIEKKYKMRLGRFNHFLTDMSEMISRYEWSISDDSFAEFKRDLIRLGKDKDKFYDIVESEVKWGSNRYGKFALDFVKDYKKFNGDLYEFVEELFDPKKNGFDLKNYNASFKAPKDNEVWTDSDCLLIDYTKYDYFTSSLAP